MSPKHKIRQYKDDDSGWADNEWAQDLRRALDKESIRRYSGRRIFRLMNTYRIRNIMRAAEVKGKH